MKKTKKMLTKLFSLSLILAVLVCSCVPAFAAGINSYEQSVLTQMKIPANMKGNKVYVPSSYINQAEARFNTIDMTAEQASKINSIISQGRSFLEGTGKASMKDLSPAQKRQIISYASAAAGVLKLTAAVGSDTSQVKVMDENGNVIIDESGAVIKKTGAEATSSFLPEAFAFAIGVITVVACAGIVYSKKTEKI